MPILENRYMLKGGRLALGLLKGGDYFLKGGRLFKEIRYLQKRENGDLTENAFLSVSRVLFELQRPTIPHFKGNLIIKNSFAYFEAI